MWFKLFYWLRIFGNTAFFIKLTARTFRDIGAFLVIFALSVLATANIFIFFMEENMEYTVANSAIFAFRASLGDFETDDFKGSSEGWLWIIYIGVTFIIQITFLNMLIAIMGDTFDKVMETKPETSLSEKIEMLAGYIIVLQYLKVKL